MNATAHNTMQLPLAGHVLCGCTARFIFTVDHQKPNTPAALCGNAVHSNPGAVVAQLPR
jgi:hypothetical protein